MRGALRAVGLNELLGCPLLELHSVICEAQRNHVVSIKLQC